MAPQASTDVLVELRGDGLAALGQSSGLQEALDLGGQSAFPQLMLATVSFHCRTNVAQKCLDFSHINLDDNVHFSFYSFPPYSPQPSHFPSGGGLLARTAQAAK